MKLSLARQEPEGNVHSTGTAFNPNPATMSFNVRAIASHSSSSWRLAERLELIELIKSQGRSSAGMPRPLYILDAKDERVRIHRPGRAPQHCFEPKNIERRSPQVCQGAYNGRASTLTSGEVVINSSRTRWLSS